MMPTTDSLNSLTRLAILTAAAAKTFSRLGMIALASRRLVSSSIAYSAGGATNSIAAADAVVSMVWVTNSASILSAIVSMIGVSMAMMDRNRLSIWCANNNTDNKLKRHSSR